MKCPNEGTLQAYLDGESAEAADHVQACAACRARLARLESTAARVNALLGDLDLCGAGYPARGPAFQRVQPPLRAGAWAAVALAAAASIALFFVSAPSPKEPTAPVVQARMSPIFTPPKPVARAPKRIHRQPNPKALPPPNNDFVALDDGEPMQMGMVVRVMLPVTDASLTGGAQGVAADLAIGEDGRPRAFRLVR